MHKEAARKKEAEEKLKRVDEQRETILDLKKEEERLAANAREKERVQREQ